MSTVTSLIDTEGVNTYLMYPRKFRKNTSENVVREGYFAPDLQSTTCSTICIFLTEHFSLLLQKQNSFNIVK